jgi:hypothetical protein
MKLKIFLHFLFASAAMTNVYATNTYQDVTYTDGVWSWKDGSSNEKNFFNNKLVTFSKSNTDYALQVISGTAIIDHTNNADIAVNVTSKMNVYKIYQETYYDAKLVFRNSNQGGAFLTTFSDELINTGTISFGGRAVGMENDPAGQGNLGTMTNTFHGAITNSGYIYFLNDNGGVMTNNFNAGLTFANDNSQVAFIAEVSEKNSTSHMTNNFNNVSLVIDHGGQLNFQINEDNLNSTITNVFDKEVYVNGLFFINLEGPGNKISTTFNQDVHIGNEDNAGFYIQLDATGNQLDTPSIETVHNKKLYVDYGVVSYLSAGNIHTTFNDDVYIGPNGYMSSLSLINLESNFQKLTVEGNFTVSNSFEKNGNVTTSINELNLNAGFFAVGGNNATTTIETMNWNGGEFMCIMGADDYTQNANFGTTHINTLNLGDADVILSLGYAGSGFGLSYFNNTSDVPDATKYWLLFYFPIPIESPANVTLPNSPQVYTLFTVDHFNGDINKIKIVNNLGFVEQVGEIIPNGPATFFTAGHIVSVNMVPSAVASPSADAILGDTIGDTIAKVETTAQTQNSFAPSTAARLARFKKMRKAFQENPRDRVEASLKALADEDSFVKFKGDYKIWLSPYFTTLKNTGGGGYRDGFDEKYYGMIFGASH